MSLKRVFPAELALGQSLDWNVYDEAGHLLLAQGQMISNETLRSGLLERGLYYESKEVPIQVEATKDSPFDLVAELQIRLDRLLVNQERVGNFPSRVYRMAQTIQSLCLDHADATLATILLDRDVRYSVRHALHVAIVVEIVGESWGMSEFDRTSMIAAALTMNIAMQELQDQLHSQAQPLTVLQRELIRNHPAQSAERLRQLQVADPTWLTTVEQHHEALDGSGYPHGVSGDQIILPAQFIHLAEIYTAKLVNRTYRKPISPVIALRTVFLARGSSVDPKLAELLIKVMGIYPPGTVVRLKSNEIGLVTHRGRQAHFPVVTAMLDGAGVPHVSPLKRDVEQPAYKIVEILRPAQLTMKFNRSHVWGYV